MATFKTTIHSEGKNKAGIIIPDAIIEELGAGKRPPVKVTLKGYTYRSTVAVMGGRYMVGVNSTVRAESGVKGGDTLDVTIELDTEERKVTVPDALQKALDENPAAKRFFESLSYSRQRVHAESIGSAKTPETLQRRIDKSISELIAGKK
ncbi:hypothetical protein GCM10007415_22150 [Parapedobacter pyrenivorans]|uniref:Bacteriocin-protection, YdeI or OmpD-Associated n=1 Tax=Parapedobacter pyrenivorans TaxID=1305674 RepID=A0A917MBZ9_9SPHI|nr:YdeI/OmpD-associated family protein [Parapedobacter pyrenivorans]GGG87813.1 hypothetical protein GCM10007415_22150 [Parapedobacter pyrenivorans]